MVLKSYSGHTIARLTRNANPILPEDVRGVLGKYIDELDQKLDPNTPPSGPAEKNLGQADGNYPGKAVEQRLQQTGQKIEELGRRADQKIEELGRQAHEALNPQPAR